MRHCAILGKEDCLYYKLPRGQQQCFRVVIVLICGKFYCGYVVFEELGVGVSYNPVDTASVKNKLMHRAASGPELKPNKDCEWKH